MLADAWATGLPWRWVVQQTDGPLKSATRLWSSLLYLKAVTLCRFCRFAPQVSDGAPRQGFEI